LEGNVVNGKPLVYLEDVSNHTVSDAGQVILVNCQNINVENLNLSNTLVGLELWATNNSKTTNNNITANNQCGIYLYGSYSSKFYHNNFIENTVQVYDYSWDHPETPPSINTWDDGYPSGGNYWSNFDCSDLFSGPLQNEAGSDGIGEPAYSIAAYNKDRYPLMAPYGTFDSGTWNGTAYNVDIVGTSVSGFQVNLAQKTIGFNVTGFCRITIPNIIVDDLWQGNYTVLLSGEPWPFADWTDTTNTYIYVNYTQSEHQIIIIPELPQALILPLFMALSMLVIVLARKKERASFRL
jgi:parallel beta-helix repeat protein